MWMKVWTMLTPLILAGGIVLGLFFFKKNNRVSWFIFSYLIAEIFLEIISRYFGTTGNRNNLIFLSIAGLLDVCFFTLFYQFVFFEKRRYWLLILSAIVFGGLLIFMGKSVESNFFHAYDKVLANLVVIVYAVISSFDLIIGKGPVRKDIMRINAAVLLFFSLDLLFMLTQNFLINAGLQYVIYFFVLRVLFLQVLYFIFVVTIWKTGKNPKQ